MIKVLKKSYCFWLPLLLTAGLLGLRMVFYGTYDDVLLYDMVTSYPTNAHSEQVMFISVIYGYILKFLYGILPAVNWFGVLYLAFYNLGFITLYKILDKHGFNPAFIALLSGMHVYFLMRISFTTIAFVLATAGVLWAVEHVEKPEKKSVMHILYSLFLMLCAFGVRREGTFYCIVLIFIPLFIFSIIKKRNSVAAIITVLVLLTVSNYSMSAVQTTYKNTIPETMYFNEFQSYRSPAQDEGSISYKAHKEDFEKAGLSANDIKIFKNYIYGDKEAYSAEKLKAIADSRTLKDKYTFNIIEIAKDVLTADKPMLNYFFYCGIVALLSFVLYKKKRLEIAASTAFIAAAELYLYVRKRGVTRVTFPVAMLGIVILLYTVVGEENPLPSLFKGKAVNVRKWSRAVCALVLAGTIAVSAACMYVYQSRFKDFSEPIAYMAQDKDTTYLSIPKTRDRLFDRHLTVLTKNYEEVPVEVICGDWYIYSYYYYDLLKKCGKEDFAFQSLNAFLEDDVKVILNYPDMADMLVKYYKEHYQLKVAYTVIKEFDTGKMAIYDFKVLPS